MPDSTGPRFKLSAPVTAVKLEERPGSRLRNPTQTLVEIPSQAIVELEGAVSHSGLATILWNGEAFSAYFEDFEKNTRPLAQPES
jgi:hypothetical protein